MDTKEFFSRWKQGIMSVTPEQRLLVDMFSIFIIFCGCVAGVIITLIDGGLWYITLIFLGMGILQATTNIAKYQQYITLKSLKEGFDLK